MQALKLDDEPHQKEFAVGMLRLTVTVSGRLFQWQMRVYEIVNNDSCRNWGPQNLHEESVSTITLSRSMRSQWLDPVSSTRRWLTVQITWICFTYLQSFRWPFASRHFLSARYCSIWNLGIWAFLDKNFPGWWTGGMGQFHCLLSSLLWTPWIFL